MTFIEAIESGKAIRRAGKKGWTLRSGGACYAGKNGWFDPAYLLQDANLTVDDVLANDWEVMAPQVTITRERFLEAFGAAYTHEEHARKELDARLALTICRELGLEE